MTCRIELARPEHIPVFPVIEQAAAGVFPEEDLSAEQRSKRTPVEIFEKAQQEKRLWTLVDEDTDQPIGFVALEPAELSSDMEKLFKKEATGSDISKRVMMQLDL